FAGLALNVLAIPLMAVAQVAGMALVPIALVSSRVAGWCGFFAHVGAAGLVQSANLIRFAPIVMYRVAPPAVWTLFVYYGALVAWWTLRTWRATASGSGEHRLARSLRRTALAVAVAAGIWILAEPWALWS